MPRPIRVIQWATGAMGRTALRRIIDHPDLELVGVYVYSPKKAGRDAGEIAKRPATGVICTGDIDRILALDADVVIHTPRITLPYDAMNADVARLLASGKNVISTAGFHYPEAHGADYVAPLLLACAEGGTTLTGLGVNPGFVVERLTLAATGLCHEIERITISETVDASAMASADFVFGLMGFGADPARNDITQGPLAALYTSLFSEVLYLAAHGLNDAVAKITPAHEVTTAPRDIVLPAGTIPAGTVAATRWRWIATLASGIDLTLSILWTADPALHPEQGLGHWNVHIEGRPNVRLTLAIDEGDPTAPPARALTDATIAVAIAGIPAVLAATPGFFAFPAPTPFHARLEPAT
ncbi:NAD(P)H-dependent amine dehydrogenase family protein [Sphingomonas sp. Leaf357]|uniref:NAD(P)H-dependent amine dehydrogenase family protein n=1 Tax=Sphingomonas sp. Leaf357 TaxID=1736350 RepID=UPI0012E216D9|nr:dihydrodipicolinate reductase [Sphingomonas sp. Leaf357]